MVKAEVKTPNKRKSVGNFTPAKKPKLEKNGKNTEKTPKKTFQTPKNEQQLSAQKSNKKNKPNQPDSPKKVKPFTSPKQPDNKQKKQKQSQNEGDNQSPEKKKKRKNQYGNLTTLVREKEGSKDPELLKSLNERISSIKSRSDLTKTAKRKLAVLQKLKLICEEGSAAAAAAAKEGKKTAKEEKTGKKLVPQQTTQANKKKAAAAKVKPEEDSDDEEESNEEGEEESGEEEESGDEDDSDAEAKKDEDSGEEEDNDDDDDDDDEEDDDDDSEDEAPTPKGKSPPAKQSKIQTESVQAHKANGETKKQIDLDELKSSNLVSKGQKRFVLFVGNIPYDTTKQDLVSHFNKAGELLDVRIPTEKGSNKPRGFGYIEVDDEVTYQKCLSMHHSQIKGRRINVLYTQGGKKKGEDKKKEIKAKNMKLHGLRKQGKLAGSVKQSQKRSFRRNKSKEVQSRSEN